MIRTPRPTGRPSLVGGPRSDWSPRWPQPPSGRSRLMGEMQPPPLQPPSNPEMEAQLSAEADRVRREFVPQTVADLARMRANRTQIAAPGQPQPLPPPNWPAPPPTVPDPTAPGFSNPQPGPLSPLNFPSYEAYAAAQNSAAPGFANPQPLPNAEVGAPFQGAPVSPRLVGNRLRRPPTMGVPIPAAPAPMAPAPAPAPAAPVNPWTNIFKQRFR